MGYYFMFQIVEAIWWQLLFISCFGDGCSPSWGCSGCAGPAGVQLNGLGVRVRPPMFCSGVYLVPLLAKLPSLASALPSCHPVLNPEGHALLSTLRGVDILFVFHILWPKNSAYRNLSLPSHQTSPKRWAHKGFQALLRTEEIDSNHMFLQWGH